MLYPELLSQPFKSCIFHRFLVIDRFLSSFFSYTVYYLFLQLFKIVNLRFANFVIFMNIMTCLKLCFVLNFIISKRKMY
jgi:hypothetical protein